MTLQVSQRGTTSHVHKTWADTFRSKPQTYYQPTTYAEVQELVLAAKKAGATLMTVGSGHSPSDLTMTDQYMVNLDKLNRLLSVNPHSSGKYSDVTVEAGMRVFELNSVLDSHGLALQNLGSITDQSIAGLISTGSHGSTAFQGILSRQIVSLKLVDGNGELVSCSSDENPRLFRAALLSLGKIGIIVEATVRVVPSFRVKSYEQVIDFDELTDPRVWNTVWTSSEFIRIWWYPYVGKCVLWRGCKTKDEPTEAAKEFGNGGIGGKLWRLFYQSLLFISLKIVPSFTPSVSNWVFKSLYGHLEKTPKKELVVQKSFDAFSLDCLYSQYVNEWALPMDNGLEALKTLARKFLEARRNGEYFINDPVEVRCSNNALSKVTSKQFEERVKQREEIDIGAITGNDLKPYLDTSPELGDFEAEAKLVDGSMSKCPLVHNTLLTVPETNVTNSQLTLYLNLVMYRPFGVATPFGKFFKKFEDVLIPVGGKPHWAKNFIGDESYLPKELRGQHYADGDMIGFYEKTKKWYGEDLVEFQKIRREIDPDNVFLSGKAWAVRNGIVEIDE